MSNIYSIATPVAWGKRSELRIRVPKSEKGFNWYRDSSDWKPFHHDSAAYNPGRARNQNITVGVSFGATRELSFLNAKNGTRIYFPQTNGMMFAFGRDVNINWKHGINALPEEEHNGKGRISIVLWGLSPKFTEEDNSPGMLLDNSGGGGHNMHNGHGHNSSRNNAGRGGGGNGGRGGGRREDSRERRPNRQNDNGPRDDDRSRQQPRNDDRRPEDRNREVREPRREDRPERGVDDRSNRRDRSRDRVNSRNETGRDNNNRDNRDSRGGGGGERNTSRGDDRPARERSRDRV
eukprot:gene22266-28380_t